MDIKVRFTNGAIKRSVTIDLGNMPGPGIDRVFEHIREFMAGSNLSSVTGPLVSGKITEQARKMIEEAWNKASSKDVRVEALYELGVEKPISTVQLQTKKLPIINHERTLGVTLADRFPGLKELIAEAADAAGKGENQPGLSGVKFNEDGEARLKTRYFCKNLNCQKMGVRYVPDGSAYCKCMYCNTKLKLRPASLAEPQSNTVFFIGDTLYVEGMND